MVAARALIQRIRRGWRELWLRDLVRRRPAGFCHWRLFWPGGNARLRLRRRLWLGTRYRLPAVLWLPLELLRYALWRALWGPEAVARAMAAHAERLQHTEGIEPQHLQAALQRWVGRWAMPVSAFMRWHIYRPKADALSYVLVGETQSYHRWQNRALAGNAADARGLADKVALAERLQRVGVPTVPTLLCSDGHARDLKTARARCPAVFCKLRAGKAGLDAFFVQADGRGACLEGSALTTEAEVQAAWQRLCRHGSVVVQPLLQNHPALAPFAAEGRAITLRVITRRQSGHMRLWQAFAELPLPALHSGRQYYQILPVQAATGLLGLPPVAADASLLPYDAAAVVAGIGALPAWPAVVQHSLCAHRQMPALWAVAWDWVLTPDGPVLLEGNSGWGLHSLQDMHGGLLPANP